MGKDSGISQSNKNRNKYHNDLINLFLNRQLSILKKTQEQYYPTAFSSFIQRLTLDCMWIAKFSFFFTA